MTNWCFVTAFVALGQHAIAAESGKPNRATEVATRIDEFVDENWKANNIIPAAPADDAQILRRVTLDLVGRIPIPQELARFQKDKSSDKRIRIIQALIDGPEFTLHFGTVLDQFIQGRFAGNDAFIDYLRRGLRKRKSWDVLYREIMLGPWNTDDVRPANRFLDKRAKTLDVLTSDAARVFFGVDISCAKCHDHPLVEDWTQAHFYGMAAFFNRTTGGKGKISEKNDGEVKFLGKDDKETTAKMMFLSGRVVDEPMADDPKTKKKRDKFSRRAKLVSVSLDEKTFFSRAIVNRLWEYFFGRGLVTPVDQMHSANEAAVGGLLGWLADDFAANGYDLHRLIAAIVSTQAYQLGSKWPDGSAIPDEQLYAVARVRPLSRRQLAVSLLLATENFKFTDPQDIEQRTERLLDARGFGRVQQYLKIEQAAIALSPSFDTRTRNFQSSTHEALFMSNNEAIQELVRANTSGTSNLTARLAGLDDSKRTVEAAIRSVYCRNPHGTELSELTEWFNRQNSTREKKCEQLVWGLITSAEFRFIH